MTLIYEPVLDNVNVYVCAKNEGFLKLQHEQARHHTERDTDRRGWTHYDAAAFAGDN